MDESSKKEWPSLICGLILAFFVLGWMAVTIFGTFFKDDLSGKEFWGAYPILLRNCYDEFPSASNIQIEVRYGNNVRVYMGEQEFEDVPYPDRDTVVERLAWKWFNHISGAYLPVFSIHDIRTGKTLASYSWSFGKLMGKDPHYQRQR